MPETENDWALVEHLPVSVSEQRLHDALTIEREWNKREHMKTRMWFLLVVAPLMGASVAQTSSLIVGILAGLGTLVFALGRMLWTR